MSRFKTALLAGVVAAGFGAAAEAAPITGQIGFAGLGSFDANQATIDSALVMNTTESFGIIATFTSVTFTAPLQYAPLTLGLIWSLTDAQSDSASFVASSGSANYSANFTDFTYQGMLSLTGFTDTAGVMTISFDNPDGLARVVFSSNATATVPEPASLALLGLGLLGLGFATRRRSEG